MELKDYLKKNRLKLKNFCDETGLNYGYLRHISNKRRIPSPEMALRIEIATGGNVDRLELLYPNSKN
jgi:transcriptional regulator with XRE-family HTH domain